MKIFILEDNTWRIDKFKELFKNHTLFICSDVQTAKQTCLNNTFEIMFLDHDLSGKIWQDSNEENTGYQFVKWMVDNGFHKNSLNYIHSMNPVGANLMLNYLKANDYDGIWIPFHQLKF